MKILSDIQPWYYEDHPAKAIFRFVVCKVIGHRTDGFDGTFCSRCGLFRREQK